MASYNRIILVGNLTRDPQLSYTASNTPVCKFGIATNRKWKDREGQAHEDVCFVDCALFGRGGEVFNQYMSKGRSVLVEGHLTLGQWTTPEGEKRSKHEVFVESFTFLGGGRDGGGQRMSADRGSVSTPVDAVHGGGSGPAEAYQGGVPAPVETQPGDYAPPSGDGVPF